ncbi:hypothetical protein LUZ60_016927 [Juncus effusus]|nr:hypothetical protein LUZ60_016927 [Juncus effusus]
MACQGFWEGLLKLLNFALAIMGLVMVVYGVHLLVELNKITGKDENIPVMFQLGTTVLSEFDDLSNILFDKLPKAWFIYLFTGVGGTLFIISLFGYIGAVTRNQLCLSFLMVSAFILLDPHWKDVIRADKTGRFHEIYGFLEHNWKVIKWVALGVVILEALAFLVAYIVRAVNAPPELDSDEEYNSPRADSRQNLIQRLGINQEESVDQEDSHDQDGNSNNSWWSQRMREKYGLDTSKFTYNPVNPAPTDEEERRPCSII